MTSQPTQPATTADVPAALGPLDAPNDRMSFEQLSREYNYRRTSNWQALFTRLVIDQARSMDRPVRALDIGCGQGIGRKPHFTAEVRRVVDEFWGIEPDPNTEPAEGVFDHFQHALLEDADLPENHFDLAYSFMVVEHVAEPLAFMRAVARCLRPGGVHMFITVNGRHYFARVASTMKKLRVDEMVLRAVRGEIVEEYHYPVQYRMNTDRRITRLASETGFRPPEYVFVEEDGPKQYFPRPTRPIYHAMAYKRKVMRDPRSLLSIICRMEKE